MYKKIYVLSILGKKLEEETVKVIERIITKKK
jgi:hypothetical protein